MNDLRNTLLLHNSGHWQGCFVRLDHTGKEQERFTTSLEVMEKEGVIQTCLTYKESGRQQSMNFESLPPTMQVTQTGDWSTGPNFITPWNWVAELCVVNQQQRRRMIVRHGVSGLDRVIYVVEAKQGIDQTIPLQQLHCQSTAFGSFLIWKPEPGVELFIDPRDRQQGDITGCGIRWCDDNGITHKILRQYNAAGALNPLADDWIDQPD
jgi:hypothetical protein